MKRKSNISAVKQISTILLGVVIAVVLGFGQTGFFNQEITKPAVEQDSNSNEDTTEEVVLVQSVNAIASIAQLHISHVLYFISETILSDSPKITIDYLEKPYLETYLNIIFRQIISPNAP